MTKKFKLWVTLGLILAVVAIVLSFIGVYIAYINYQSQPQAEIEQIPFEQEILSSTECSSVLGGNNRVIYIYQVDLIHPNYDKENFYLLVVDELELYEVSVMFKGNKYSVDLVGRLE